MRLFIVIYFCGFLSSGKLDSVNNSYNIWSANADTVPIAEGPDWPTQQYQAFLGKYYYGTGRRNNSPKRCSEQTDSQIEHQEQPKPSATRRAYTSEKEKVSTNDYDLIKIEPQHPTLVYKDNEFESFNQEESIKGNNQESNLQNPEVNNEESTIDEDLQDRQYSSLSTDGQIAQDSETAYPTGTIPVQEIERITQERLNQDNTLATEESKIQASQTETPSKVDVKLPVLVNKNRCSDKTEVVILSTGPRRSLPPIKDHKTDLHGNNAPEATTEKLTIEKLKEIRKAEGPIHKIKSTEEQTSVGHILLNNKNNINLNDPTKGDGIAYMTRTSKMMLRHSDRVCYACSSANNPSCLAPDRRTTVKYCRKGYASCVVKTIGTGSTLTLIRDCAKTCFDTVIPGVNPEFRSCSICHADLCNSAYTTNVSTLILTLTAIVSIVAVKPLF